MKRLWLILPALLMACATAAPEPSPRQVVISETGEELVAPRIIRRAPPDYPSSLRRRGIQGSVELSAEIGVDGIPRNIEVRQSSHPALNNLAVEALRKWRFEPGTQDGEPVPVTYTTTINFNLR